jgi:hypothetical protein
MDTFQAPSLPLGDEPIPDRILKYFQAHLRYALHAYVVDLFYQQASDPSLNLTKAKLGRRLGKAPARISRLLGRPGNWTLDTISELLVGMGVDPRTPFDKIAAWDAEHAVADRATGGLAAVAKVNAAPHQESKSETTPTEIKKLLRCLSTSGLPTQDAEPWQECTRKPRNEQLKVPEFPRLVGNG